MALRTLLLALVLAALAVVSVAAVAECADSRSLMFVFTTDTGGEVNPCG
jgi:hypothetical protein